MCCGPDDRPFAGPPSAGPPSARPPPPDGSPPDRPPTALRRTAQKFALFSLSRPPFSFFLSLWGSSRVFFSLTRGSSRVFYSLSGGLLVEFWWCFGRPGPSNVRVFALELSCESLPAACRLCFKAPVAVLHVEGEFRKHGLPHVVGTRYKICMLKLWKTRDRCVLDGKSAPHQVASFRLQRSFKSM